MALQTEVWVKEIQETLEEQAPYIALGVDHGMFVVNKTVHLPQSGAASAITKNRSSFPATAAQRTDTDNTYDLDSYTTAPVHVTDFEDLQVSYSKRQSVMGQHYDILAERIGRECAQAWAANGSITNVIQTTGATTSPLPPSATGTRKLVTVADIISMAKKLDEDNVSTSGRYLVMNTIQYYELFAISDLISRDFMNKGNLPSGIINELMGFQIMVKPTVVLYSNATGTLKAIGAAGAATDAYGCIAFQSNFVAKAMGDTKIFFEENSPLFYGDIWSAEVVFGGKMLRTDQKGVVALSQGQ